MSVELAMNHVAKDNRRTENFEAQIIEHMGMMRAVALKLTRDPIDADDLVQNTVLKALRFHDKFKEGTYIKAWLLTILRNSFINEYRRKTRRPVSVELTGNESAQDSASDPEIPLVRKENTGEELLECVGDEVNAAMENLPVAFRIPVIMADLEDKSYKEIAAYVGCPLGTVMSRLYRGRQILREQLRDYAVNIRVLTS